MAIARILLVGLTSLAVVGAGAYRSRRAETVARPTISVAVDSLGSPAAPGSGEPSLVAAPDGRVYMTWLEPSADSTHALRLAVHDGTRWSDPITIRRGRDFFVNWADFPSLEVLEDGRLAAHWLQRTGRSTYAYGVRISQSRDGGRSWSAPVAPHRDSSQTEHGFVTMWREGTRVGAVWLDGRKYSKEGHAPENEMMLMATTIDVAGQPGAEMHLDERTCDCCQTAAAMTARGPIVAYRDRSPAEIRDIYVVRRVGGKWTAPAAVHNDGWHIAACPVNGPAIAASGSQIALAWFTAANDTPRVNVAFSTDAGATFDRPIRVDGGKPAGRVDVLRLRDGSALVSWIERTGGDTAAVRLRRININGQATAPVTVATSSAARASGFPRMALSGEKVMLAWTVPGRPSQVRVARLALATLR